MNLTRLSEFAIIANCGSIAGAAEKLGVSSATLCARLHTFEETLGAVLFKRNGRRMVLTPAGARLLPNAEELLKEYRRVVRSIYAVKRYSYRSLKICLISMAMPLHLGPFLDRLNAENPDIQLELLDATSMGISASLLSGDADLYFATMMDQIVSPELVRQTVSGPSHYVLLTKTHPLAGQGTLTLKQLDGECFILYPRTAESCARNFQLTNLNAAGIRYSVYDSATGSSFVALLVPIGKGILLTPMPIINPPPGTISIPVLGVAYPASTYCYSMRAAANPDVAIFIQDFTAFTQQMTHQHQQFPPELHKKDGDLF